jgi:hypothetical protein
MFVYGVWLEGPNKKAKWPKNGKGRRKRGREDEEVEVHSWSQSVSVWATAVTYRPKCRHSNNFF